MKVKRLAKSLFLLLITALTFDCSAAGFASASDELELGRRIYQEGISISGAPLAGIRFGSVAVKGSEAACVNCHRRSGMGSVEGDIQVPPVTGRFLFAKTEDKAVATMDLRRGKRMNQRHEPYTDTALANAIRKGINSSGREMSVMMPRYELDEKEMKALIAYLRQLSAEWSPGVTADTIRFATVITPGVEPERQKAMLDMMRAAFVQKNGSTVTGKGIVGRRHMVTAAEMILGTERKWELDVWELGGPPDSWAGQLKDYYSRNPVFAVISGLTNTTWEPVHDFCEREQVPCWFPSIDLPSTGGFYTVYFNRGVALEADVFAKHLLADKKNRPHRLIQVYGDDYVGRGAAKALTQALSGSGIPVENRVIDNSKGSMNIALAGITEKDAVMFWFRGADLAALKTIVPPPGEAKYFSAMLAGGEHGPFPAAWKGSARLVYPYEMPDQREANMANFNAWIKMRQFALVDEQLQAEVYFSIDFLTETISEMLDNIYRDYLIERAESMLSIREARKADESAKQLLMIGKAGKLPGKRESTTIYPRLSLASGQRFASRGGYIVRFAGVDSDKLVAESGWIVP